MNIRMPLADVVARAVDKLNTVNQVDELKWAYDYFTGIVDGYFYSGAVRGNEVNEARNRINEARAIARSRCKPDPWPTGEYPISTTLAHAQLRPLAEARHV